MRSHSFAVFLLAALACDSPNAPPDRLIVRFDAGTDANDDAAADAPATVNSFDAGAPLGAPCVDDGQCDDHIACTYDSCVQPVGRCVHVPDDSLCDNGVFCDGKEVCAVGQGCQPGPVVSCSDNNACDISKCVEATKSCVHALRDIDQDGDPDSHCKGGRDCDDLNPDVSSLHAEVCANGIDDNCNGVVDETPCVAPQGNTCANAVSAPAAGTYALSSVGCDETFATSCSVTDPTSAQNVVAAITVPPGPSVDIEVWAATSGVEVAVAIQGTCGQPSSELGCGSGAGATRVRARARNVPPGTYYAVTTTQSETAIELTVELLPPSLPATNVDCASAAPLLPGAPIAVSTVDPPLRLASDCTVTTAVTTGELTYTFQLTQPQDVRVTAATVQGSGIPVIGLRKPGCSGATDELGCRSGDSVPIYERALPPGTYVVTLAATSPIDASLLVSLFPPTPIPADQLCSSAPPLAANATVPFDLGSHEDAVKDGCFAGGPDAAYDLTLTAASDVLLIERLAESDRGGVSLDQPACTAPVACTMGSTPLRLGKRNLGAGDYRAVVADELGLQGTLDALVRQTIAPTIVRPGGADTCASAVDASQGGFFTGNTSTATADYSNPCDSPTNLPGGAPDQVLALDLKAPQRVVFDMEGSSYTTILDVRQGPSCPGAPVANGCYVGFEAQKSFLDLELAAGSYWVIVDGYDQDRGPWNLDVRVLQP